MNVMLAQPYAGQDVTGWLMSEKLDGVRALWDGRNLVSRLGNIFHAPNWFADQLPVNHFLDGELFLSRGNFQRTVSAVRKKHPVDAEWRSLTFNVFDSPSAGGGFEDRLSVCGELLRGNGVASVVDHRPCLGPEDMNSFFAEMCRLGAEGVMLRKPGSAYENCRSHNLLKLKQFDSDEAIMVGQEKGKGRLAGKTGALILNWGGVIFKVGTGLSDEERENPPEVGSRISFGYCGLSKTGVPRFPTFLAERTYE